MGTDQGVSSRLRALRQARGLTQQKLSKEIGVSREVIAKWESNGRFIPKSEDIIALADYYSVSCDYILRGVAPERLAIVRDLGLSDAAIQEMLNIKESSYRSYGFISELFDRHNGAITYILDCIDKAIDTRILQKNEQKRLEDHGELEEPVIHIGSVAEIEYDTVVRAMIREASEAFMQNACVFVDREAIKYATQGNP